MKLLFNPSILLACSDVWRDAARRDAFLLELTNWLDILNRTQDHRILWSDELEAHLWSTPERHPWHGGDFAIPIVSTLYQIFRSRVEFVVQNCEPASSDPEMIVHCSENNAPLSDALRVAHSAVHSQDEFFVCDSHLICDQLALLCSCSSEAATVSCASSSSQVLEWYEAPLPTSVSEFDIQIDTLIEQTRLLLFPNRQLTFQPKFDKAFAEDFLACSRNQKLVIKAMTKKLAMSHEEAVKDNGLRDKDYQGDKTGLRRLRVTRGCRIDYIYDSGNVLFKRYFDEGEYGDSLR
jgi:hypothetical protein